MSFKICAVGCGRNAMKYHGPSYKRYAEKYPGTMLAACCDLDESRAVQFRDAFGFSRSCTDMYKMLDEEKPDAVCLVAPVSLTVSLASAIMELGYPLMLEKPPGETRMDVMELVEISRRKNIKNQVAFNRRFCPLIAETKKSLACFEPGEIHDVRYDMFRVNETDSDFCIHAIDTVRFLADADYEHISFDYQKLSQAGSDVANVYMNCTMTSGARAHISIYPSSGVSIERSVINLQHHSLFLEIPMWFKQDKPGRLLHLQDDGSVWETRGTDLDDFDELYVSCGFYHENESFFNDIRSGRAPGINVEASVQSVEVAECVKRRVPEYRSGQHRANL